MVDGRSPFNRFEMMVICAARALANKRVCFVGIGAPNVAANLARLIYRPDLVLVYESGCIGAKPVRLPTSIGDGELAETADAVVSVPEIFNYWLQAGRIEVGFLGAAQIDRWGNLNTTVIGSYSHPSVRLPGAGGAPEIASSCGEVFVIMRHSRRSFVDQLDFRTSVGYGSGKGDRERLGLKGAGPVLVVTDLAVLRPDLDTCELTLSGLQPGVSLTDVIRETGWRLRINRELDGTSLPVMEPPSVEELNQLRRIMDTGTQLSVSRP